MNPPSSPPPPSSSLSDIPDDEQASTPATKQEKQTGASPPLAPQLHIDHSPLSKPVFSRSSSPSTSPSPPSSPSTQPRSAHPSIPCSYRLTRTSRIFILSSILLSFITLVAILDSFTHHQRDTNGCQESYMRPVYIKQTGFDSEMTRFAGKYALYLYREKDVDLSDQPTGVPVLFIPGHAGSYKQIRAIAAETSFYYYQHYARRTDLRDQGVRGLDFFTVDFHEEFSALHGQSLLEQAEYLNDAIDYILKLYPLSRRSESQTNAKLPDPTSVIIIGHSMGGVVARTMFMLSNYQPGTINTIITLSTPHILPPAPFDWKISKIYDDLHHFWKNGYGHSALSDTTSQRTRTSLQDVILISIAGGTLDDTVCSDTTNVGAFVPSTHGFTVFTTAVPHVWTGSDHLSIYSCKQLVRVLAKSMLDIVDVRRPSQTKPVEARMQVMRNAFLSGLENSIRDGLNLQTDAPVSVDLSDKEHQMIETGKRLVVNKEQRRAKISLMPKDPGSNAFALLTDQSLGNSSRFELMLCNRDKRADSRLDCLPASQIAVLVPASTVYDTQPFSGRTFSFVSLTYDEMNEFKWFAVLDRGGSDGFLVAESFSTEANTHRIDKSMLGIALHGVKEDLPASLFMTVHIPAIENPMLAYHLKVSRPSCQASDDLFAPFLRQSITTMHESKFFVNVAGNEDETDISFHGRTAFSSMLISAGDVDHKGLTLQIWMDPTCPGSIGIDLSVDWYGSLGRIGFRNGIMLATFSFIIVVLVMFGQIFCYNRTGIFPHFGQGLSFCMKRTMPAVMLLVAVCSIYQCMSSSSTFDNRIWELDMSFALQDILAGNSDPFFWWLPLAGLVMSMGTVCFLWIVVRFVLQLCASVVSFIAAQQVISRRNCRRTSETRGQRFQRRAITTLVLFVMVATCIPYQFVFVVAFLVHTITCVRSLIRTWTVPKHDQKRMNRYHYMQTLLILLITLLPFNLPILVVWVRNLAVHWFVPFSSDHDVFAIAPFMIYVEYLTGNRKMLPRTCGLWSWGTYGLMYCVVVYAFLYGIKYTHSLYFLSNYLIAWFLFLHACESHYGRMAYRYVADHMSPFRSKKHS